MKEYIAEYIIPIEEKGNDCMFDFMNAKRLIRCKDCKHWKSDADTVMACEFTNPNQQEDGFCNWAERRGEEWEE